MFVVIGYRFVKRSFPASNPVRDNNGNRQKINAGGTLLWCD